MSKANCVVMNQKTNMSPQPDFEAMTSQTPGRDIHVDYDFIFSPTLMS